MPIKKCKTLPKFISGQEVRDLISFQWDPVVSCPLCYLERVAAVKWSEVPTTSSASKNGCTILGDKSPTSSNRATLSQNNLQRLQTKPKWKGKAKVKRIRDRKTHDQALLAGVAKPRRGVVGGSRGRPRAGPEQTLIDDEDDAGINGSGTFHKSVCKNWNLLGKSSWTTTIFPLFNDYFQGRPLTTDVDDDSDNFPKLLLRSPAFLLSAFSFAVWGASFSKLW